MPVTKNALMTNPFKRHGNTNEKPEICMCIRDRNWNYLRGMNTLQRRQQIEERLIVVVEVYTKLLDHINCSSQALLIEV